jgi:hypothetical protein
MALLVSVMGFVSDFPSLSSRTDIEIPGWRGFGTHHPKAINLTFEGLRAVLAFVLYIMNCNHIEPHAT